MANGQINSNQLFDYVILGAGCAGLTLAIRMAQNSYFKDKQILILEAESYKGNDRTWCFWSEHTYGLENCILKQWHQLKFTDGIYETKQSITPYAYNIIRSEKYYRHCKQIITEHNNIQIRNEVVQHVNEVDDLVHIATNMQQYTAKHCFSSFLFSEPTLQPSDVYLLQHFKGWYIHTEKPVFDETCATLMDYSVNQKYGDAFVYVLPFSETDALVEYTLFTEAELEQEQYDEILKEYISSRFGNDYIIVEQEFGIIPMTTYKFPNNKQRITFIGTAGGATKPSTGYTFTFIQKQCDQIIACIVNGKSIDTTVHASKFFIYDATLLQLIASKQLTCKQIFTRLFQKNSMSNLLKFLNNQTSLIEDIRVMSSTQLLKFSRSFLKVLLRKN